MQGVLRRRFKYLFIDVQNMMHVDNFSKTNKKSGLTSKLRKSVREQNKKNIKICCMINKLRSLTEWGACLKIISRKLKLASSTTPRMSTNSWIYKERKRKEPKKKPTYSINVKKLSTWREEEPNRISIWMSNDQHINHLTKLTILLTIL